MTRISNILIVASVLAAGCSHSALDAGDGGVVKDMRVPDLAVGPPGPAIDGGIACGMVTCKAGQVCVIDCTGIPCDMSNGAGDCRPHFCVDLPAACETSYTCSCFPSDPCSNGSCAIGPGSDRTIMCEGCL